MIDLRKIGPDDPPPPQMMCEVCKRVLTPSSFWDEAYEYGREEPVIVWEEHRWDHPVDRDYDHDPVPVPTDLTVAAPICDFCSAPEVVGSALATPFSSTYLGFTTHDSGDWACCATCRDLLLTDPPALVERGVQVMVAKHGPLAAEPTRLLQSTFLHHFTGEITALEDRHGS